MDNAKRKTTFEELVTQGEAVMATKHRVDGYIGSVVDKALSGAWGSRTLVALRTVLGQDHDLYKRAVELIKQPWDASNAEQLLGLVRGALASLDDGIHATAPAADHLAHVKLLSDRFHTVTRELRARHDGRETLAINDEYDVQDLLRSLLRIFFDDVREEEWTPSYAGAASRMDFLLKNEKLVIEAKMSRKGLDAKKLGEELLIDIGRYAAHPDCETLVCFVYNPDGWIKNPAAIENDLSKTHGRVVAHVLIRPR